jgi:hypothetical protein
MKLGVERNFRAKPLEYFHGTSDAVAPKEDA